MTNDMYLNLMQRVLKTAGSERGTVLLEKLQERKEATSSSSNEEKSDEYKADEKIKLSINFVRESLRALEN